MQFFLFVVFSIILDKKIMYYVFMILTDESLIQIYTIICFFIKYVGTRIMIEF